MDSYHLLHATLNHKLKNCQIHQVHSNMCLSDRSLVIPNKLICSRINVRNLKGQKCRIFIHFWTGMYILREWRIELVIILLFRTMSILWNDNVRNINCEELIYTDLINCIVFKSSSLHYLLFCCISKFIQCVCWHLFCCYWWSDLFEN